MSDPVPPPQKPAPNRKKLAAQILALLAVAGAVILVLVVWSIVERHPRTDDATVRANVINVAPRVRGQIVKIPVQDNQAVQTGDVLFEIDPDDYRLNLEKAKAALTALDQQIEAARGEDAQLKYQVKAAEAGLAQAKAQSRQAGDTLARTEPLLPKGFAVADDVDKARTQAEVAASAVNAEEERLNQARAAIGTLATLTAQRPGAVAAVDLAALELSYCRVTAPFPGRVINLNISIGAYASAGVPVFSLLDTRNWYVIAEFREGEIRHLKVGDPAELYLLSAPDRHFQGRVQGVGWAVEPDGQIDLPGRVPIVRRELNWVHIAQRFPVRIQVENPDADLFRMGASADVIVKGSR
jgi:multidrug efflux system membrane fusion protein